MKLVFALPKKEKINLFPLYHELESAKVDAAKATDSSEEDAETGSLIRRKPKPQDQPQHTEPHAQPQQQSAHSGYPFCHHHYHPLSA
jgi:hypothetical protein